MLETAANCEWYIVFRSYGQVITWLIVIGGWFIINHHNNLRENRKEIRSSLDALKAELLALEVLSLSYHKESVHDDSTAREIRLLIVRISNFLERLAIGNKRVINEKVIELRKAVTLNNFDTHTHESMENNSEFIGNISYAIDELYMYMETQYSHKYLKRKKLFCNA